MVKEKAKQERHVSEEKKRMLKGLVRLILENSTIMIGSLKNVPSSQFQKIKSRLSGRASIKVVKKRVMMLAMEETSRQKNVKELEEFLEEGSAILFSQIDPFELASILADNRVAVKAKPGQIANDDIVVEAGPTDMPAGPMISELSGVGIKVAIEDGKIVIRQDSVVTKRNEKISEAAANIFTKLDILPFVIGVEPIAAYDSRANRVYKGIRIDKEATLDNLKTASANAMALAFSIAYACRETIAMLLAKASMQASSISRLIKSPEVSAPAQQDSSKIEAQNKI